MCREHPWKLGGCVSGEFLAVAVALARPSKPGGASFTPKPDAFGERIGAFFKRRGVKVKEELRRRARVAEDIFITPAFSCAVGLILWDLFH